MKRLYLLSILLVVTTLIMGACTPRASPSAPVPTTPTVAPAQPSPAPVVTADAEDAAWQKVIADAKKEGKVTHYSFNLTGDAGTAVVKAFTDRYGITLETVTGPGAQIMERIRSEQRAGQFAVDVFDSSTGLVIQAKQDGLSIKLPELPALKEKGVWFVEPGSVDADGYMILLTAPLSPPYYNTNLVKAEEAPKSWRQLLDPKWKGKIAINNPDTVPTPNRLYVIMTDRKALDVGFFQELGKQELKLYPGIRDSVAAVARGEAQIELVNATVVANALIKQGAPIKPFDMEEGIVGAGAGLSIIKNAPHPNAARLYINWFISAEGQSVFHKAINDLSLRKDVPDYRPSAIQVTPKKVFMETEKDIVEVAKVQRERILSKMWGFK